MRISIGKLPSIMFATAWLLCTLWGAPATPASGQESGGGQCWTCGWSDEKQWPSLKCYESSRGGLSECNTVGGPVTSCRPEGSRCEATTAAATDQEVLEAIQRGETLPPDGDYFYLTVGEDALVIRKCDLSPVGLVPATGLGNRHRLGPARTTNGPITP